MPYTATIELANGMTGELVMPDLYAVLASVGDVPSPEIAAVLRLLEGTGALEQQNLLQQLAGQRSYYMGLYQVAKLCLVRPVLRLDVSAEKPLQDGEVTPRDVSFNNVLQIYWKFFIGELGEVRPKSDDAEGAAHPASNGSRLRETAKRDRGGD